MYFLIGGTGGTGSRPAVASVHEHSAVDVEGLTCDEVGVWGGEASGEPDESSFAGDVVHLARYAGEDRCGTDVDDASPPALLHPGQECVGDQEVRLMSITVRHCADVMSANGMTGKNPAPPRARHRWR